MHVLVHVESYPHAHISCQTICILDALFMHRLHVQSMNVLDAISMHMLYMISMHIFMHLLNVVKLMHTLATICKNISDATFMHI